MNKSQIKKIRKYAKYRFKGKPYQIMEKVLRKRYEASSPDDQHDFDDEMDRYFDAIEKGLIEKGESIIKAYVGVQESTE